jgi:rod shape-determining protein MreC
MSRVNVIALLLVFVLVAGLLLLPGEKVEGIRHTAMGWASPLLRTKDATGTFVDGLVSKKPTYEQLEGEHRRLFQEVQHLRTLNRTLDDLYRQNSELRRALDLRKLPNFELVAAEVISRDSSTWYNTLVIDKGTNEGLKVNDAVIVETKLVGKISVAGPDSSVVLLVTDEACKVTARVMSTTYLGISEGQGSQSPSVFTGQGETQGVRGCLTPRFRLRFIDKFAKIQHGMTVFSSGQGRVYPPNLELGTIVAVKPGDITTEAEIEPAVDFSRLEFVFVIRGAPSESAAEPSEGPTATKARP